MYNYIVLQYKYGQILILLTVLQKLIDTGGDTQEKPISRFIWYYFALKHQPLHQVKTILNTPPPLVLNSHFLYQNM